MKNRLQFLLTETLIIISLGFFLARVNSFTSPSTKYPRRIPTKGLFFQSVAVPTPHITSTTSRFLSAQSSSLSERFKLSDRFDRWRFMQDVLDDFIEEETLHQVLYAVLKGFPLEQKYEETEDGSLPIATPDQKEMVVQLLDEWKSTRAIPVLTNSETLNQIEKLIPDPLEDEDGFKGSWDTVIELHGREMVKVNEQKGTERWKALSIVSRVLIHYEILTEGIRESSS